MTKNNNTSAVPTDETSADDVSDEVAAELNPNLAVVTLEWKGETFTLPKRRGRWPVKAAREFGRENYVEAIVALLGEQAWARIETVCPVVDDINDFADYVGTTIQRECIP
jgi:hypothetical protein